MVTKEYLLSKVHPFIICKAFYSDKNHGLHLNLPPGFTIEERQISSSTKDGYGYRTLNGF